MRRGAIGLVTTILLLGPAAPGAAVGQGNIGTVSPDQERIEREFEPLVGTYPVAVNPAASDPYGTFRPTACRTVTYCDTIALDVEYAERFLREVFFGVEVTLTWDNPRTESTPGGNDLDLFLWFDDDPLMGAPSSDCDNPNDPACNTLEKEVAEAIGPRDTTPGPPLLLTVVNHTGINDGYTIAVEWFTFELDFGDYPEFAPGGQEGTESNSAPEETVAGPGTPGPPEPPSPTPDDERTVLIPGPDGELVERPLPVLASGRGLEPRDQSILVPWVWATIAAIVLGTVGALSVLLRRSRSAAPDS